MTRPRQVSNERLLQAAREVFLQHGPGASTTLIAERAGVSQAVLFQRFGTKENLMFEALLTNSEDSWSEKVTQGPDERGMEIQIRELAERISGHLEAIFPALMILKSAGVCHEELFQRYDVSPPLRGFLGVKNWFEHARRLGRISDVDPGAVAMSFVGSLQSRVFLAHVASNNFTLPVDRETYLDWIADFFWQGLRPRSES